MSRLGLQGSNGDAQAVAMACTMVGGGNDGSIDLCARVCLIDEDENIIFHAYIKPSILVTNYRYLLLQPPKLAEMGFKSFWILRGVNFVYNDFEKNKNEKNEL